MPMRITGLFVIMENMMIENRSLEYLLSNLATIEDSWWKGLGIGNAVAGWLDCSSITP